MEAYKREFIEFLQGAGVLKFGDFTAKSGRKIPYFVNAGMIKTGDQITKMGEFYAKAYADKLGKKQAVLYGPAYKGISLSISAASSFSRITRAAVMQVRGMEYIESAYAMGLPTWKVIMRHIIPNCLSPIIVQVTLAVGNNIISASSLSFLGVGIPVPLPEWGAMLAEGRNYIRSAPWMCIFPGLAIMMTVLALNLMGDGLRDALDPKLKK